MNKTEFIQEAPVYYALAIASELNSKGSGRAISKYAIRKNFAALDEDDPDGGVNLLGYEALWDAAVKWLKERGMIEETKATFGPPLYSQSSDFDVGWNDLMNQPPFDIFMLVDEKASWLVSALWEVHHTYNNLGMVYQDFVDPIDEWEPIPIAPGDPELRVAIEKLSSAIDQISKDNGYAANHPEEREFVLTGLQRAVENLETASVVPGYLRDAFIKLSMVGRRFAGATLELVTAGAKQAIIDFVKQKGGALLRSFVDLIWP